MNVNNNAEAQDIQIRIRQLINELPTAFVPKSMIEQLSKFPRTETLQTLKEISNADDENLSDRAIRAILQIDIDFGKQVLLELADNPSWHWYFAYSALEYGNSSFVMPLCSILKESANSDARYMATVALERIGNVTALEFLKQALDDPGEDYEGRSISEQAELAIVAITKRAQLA